ncbi:hypothetical protein [Glycomyces sp. YM15]|uniref:hypothetical protein n=1 Tax=Glycomyces sp. YM15 TaxID=2800446 RepID=UPI001963A4B8|nr:hypothetical protein [Glycomyces sp. YM15]
MTETPRVTFRIDAALWTAYWESAASAGHDPAALLAAILTAWSTGTPLPRRPDDRPAVAWGRSKTAGIAADTAWWVELAAIGTGAGYTRADLIDRACRWWLNLDTLPPTPTL